MRKHRIVTKILRNRHKTDWIISGFEIWKRLELIETVRPLQQQGITMFKGHEHWHLL
ncbi:MAG: hypothetical protein LBI18_14315 [Planctomycetaceae bacterium]|nr:hypothetical protein [Planctomycetaceae bacterium]